MIKNIIRLFLNDNFILFGLVLLVIALPLSRGIMSATLVGLFIVSMVKATYYLQNYTPKWLYNKAPLLALLLFLPFVLSILNSTNWPEGVDFAIHQNALLFLPIIVYIQQHLIVQKFKIILHSFILANVVAGLITLFFFILPQQSAAHLVHQLGFLQQYELNNQLAFGLYSPFIARIQFANLLGISILSSFFLLKDKTKTWIIIPQLFILLITNFYLGGRAGLIGLFTIVVFGTTMMGFYKIYPYLKKKVNKFLALFIIIIAIISSAILLPFIAINKIPSIKERYIQTQWEISTLIKNTYQNYDYQSFTTLRRVVSWQNHWKLIQQNWILGTGTGDYEQELQKVYDKDNFDLSPNSHSQYLYVWASSGIFALIVFITLPIFALYKIYKNSTVVWFIYSCCFMLFYAIVFIGDAVLLKQIDTVVYSFWFSTLLLYNKNVKCNQNNKLNVL